ncbi:hypothetical protein GCM10011375_22570 [Hymenobacter qilianensis]|uniref:Uncharacterized protein n=2 Tax=Hymenobacter qilianensis TaxID=1385715 RepID=A0ACB5PSB9_9BACT|nr:hypothetical protein [Hymenobacter qilianensis]QNP52372.1 hypothetical protein H9L05_00775 [Hymenobacter qilianensis]GGF67028.1 hypothetical protein GCM10011375_22570 [Hymenobacter qilianensis]
MQSFVALLLCVLALAGGLLPRHDLAELGRLPRLLEHYRQHQATFEALTFAEFLALHYGRPGQAAPTPEHQGLPLHDGHYAPVPVICTGPLLVCLPVVGFRAWPALAYSPADSPRYPGGHAPACWQPPCA